MSLPLITAPDEGEIFFQIAQDLEHSGFAEIPVALPEQTLAALFVHFKSLDENRFEPAGIGRERDYQHNNFVRTDEIFWLKRSSQKVGLTDCYFQWAERLRLELNRRLFLGLFDYECHYAQYTTGAFYKKHLDAFRGSNSRKISTVLYLNPNWQSGDGGELVLYDPASPDKVLHQIEPSYGKLVLFLSEEFPHEVLVVNKPRYSLTGWFRINNTIRNNLDPPV